MLDVAEIFVEVSLDNFGRIFWCDVGRDEHFGECVEGLVVFVFQAAGSKCFCEALHIRVRCVGFEKRPDWVISWRAVMESDDFFDQGFPPVGAVINSLG